MFFMCNSNNGRQAKGKRLVLMLSLLLLLLRLLLLLFGLHINIIQIVGLLLCIIIIAATMYSRTRL